MTDITVTCGCGRKMRVDTLRGRGAFACGCGIRIRVDTAPSEPQCVGFAGDALTRCHRSPVRESAKFNLSLCGEHYGEYVQMLDVMQRSLWVFANLLPAEEMERRERERKDREVVYYVRLRDTIKIGMTSNMRTRMEALVPDEILATEPGGHELERLRQQQFAHLHIRGERFRIDQELLDHAAMLRKQFGSRLRRPDPAGSAGQACAVPSTRGHPRSPCAASCAQPQAAAHTHTPAAAAGSPDAGR